MAEKNLTIVWRNNLGGVVFAEAAPTESEAGLRLINMIKEGGYELRDGDTITIKREEPR